MSLVLVIDVGTSSVKAVAFDRDGRIFAESEAPYKTVTDADGRQEQNPLDWIDATRMAIRRLDTARSRIQLLVLSGTMQSVIPVDANGRPVRSAILYSDGRATEELQALKADLESIGGAALIGNAPNEFMSAFKIEWMRRHEPQLYAKTAVFHSGAKDFVAQWLTGAVVTDPTAASTVGLMDLNRMRWAEQALALFQLSADRLPAIRSGSEVIGTLIPERSEALGLPARLQVVNGSGDAGASTLGAGIQLPGHSYIYVGTTAWAAQISSSLMRPADMPEAIYTLAHPNRSGRVIRIGAMLAGGDSAAWFSTAARRSLTELDALIGAPSFERSNALFLPYLKGERCPFNDSAVRGAFLNLCSSDGPAHLHFAVLEGIALALRTNLDALGPVTGEVMLLGGGALSAHLPQILADILARPVAVAASPATVTALGGLRLGAAHMGWTVPDPSIERRFTPNSAHKAQTGSRLALFQQATALARQFAALQ